MTFTDVLQLASPDKLDCMEASERELGLPYFQAPTVFDLPLRARARALCSAYSTPSPVWAFM